MVIGIPTNKYNNDVIVTVEVSNFGFILYVLGYTMDNILHDDTPMMAIPIEEPTDVCYG